VDVERALAQLPPRYREVVVLHELEGYTHDEIAELLGIEPGTSKSQLHHARRRLRTLIGED
jgi:RNA polymerase sigma-70 factor (ECF subfamily)